MVHIAVCDDSPAELETVCEGLERYRAARPGFELQIEAFTSPKKLLNSARMSNFQLYLLDILMPERTGIDLAMELAGLHQERPVIIFLTSSPDYSLEAYRVRALNYLLKPVEEKDLFYAMDEVAALLRKEERESFTVAAAEGLLQVRASSVTFAESMQHVVLYHLADGTTLRSRNMRASFESVAEMLAGRYGFLRPHRSYAINPAQVMRMSHKEFIMNGGAIIPISKLRLGEVKSDYLKYLGDRGPAR